MFLLFPLHDAARYQVGFTSIIDSYCPFVEMFSLYRGTYKDMNKKKNVTEFCKDKFNRDAVDDKDGTDLRQKNRLQIRHMIMHIQLSFLYLVLLREFCSLSYFYSFNSPVCIFL